MIRQCSVRAPVLGFKQSPVVLYDRSEEGRGAGLGRFELDIPIGFVFIVTGVMLDLPINRQQVI